MTRILTGRDCNIIVNGQKIAVAKNVSYNTGLIPPEYEDLIRFLAKTGNQAAFEMLGRIVTIADGTAFVPFGNARQPGESDAELRKRLKK